MGELFTSTGTSTDKGFDSTIKFTSNYLPQQAKVLTQRLHAFLSPRRENITQSVQWSNYLPQRAEILSQRSQRVNSTGKEYCESTGKYSNGRKIL